jgi:DHA1 family inner membrane transport protein
MKAGSVPALVLAIGIFGIISTEIGMVGVLPQIAAAADVSVSQAGLLVSVFALVVAVSGPFGVLVVGGLDRKAVLLATVAVFALSNAVFALSTSFPVLMVFRVIPAVLHPVYFAVALTIATSLAPTGRESTAVARVFTGVTAGFAFGVPAMAFLASTYSLPVAFWSAAVINMLAFAGIALWVPRMPAGPRAAYGDQLRILRRPRVWLQMLMISLIFAVMFSGYSYFADYLGGVSELSGTAISALLMAFGVLMIVGNLAFARLVDKGVTATLLGFLGGYLVVYLAIYAVAPSAWAMIVLIVPWSLLHSGGLLLGQSLMAREASDAPEFGNSLFVSTSNVGVTIGSALGALQLASHGTRSVVLVGAALAIAGLALAALSERRRPRSEVDASSAEPSPVHAGGR